VIYFPETRWFALGRKRRKQSAETRQKIARAMRGRVFSKETRRRMSESAKRRAAEGRLKPPPPMRGKKNPMFGKRLSDEAKQRISRANKGRKHTVEARRKMSEACRGKKVHAEEFKKALAERNRTRVFRHTEASKKKISRSSVWNRRKGDFRYKGYVQTTKGGRIGFRSLWELRAVELLEADPKVERVEYETLAVPYQRDGKSRWTLPDFRVWLTDGSQKVIEVKPRGFTYNAKERAKMGAARAFCEERGWVYEVWDERFLWPASCPRGRWVCSLPTTSVSPATSAS
jgi:hypothetical protein